MQTDGRDEDELDEYFTELHAPITPQEIEAERRVANWLKM